MPDSVWVAIIGAVVTLAVGYLTYKGARHTAAASTAVAEEAADSTEQDRAVDAWRSMVTTLLGPLEQRVADLTRDLETERKVRRDSSTEHRRQLRSLRQELDQATHRLDQTLLELEEWRRVAKTLARWGSTLRDEVLRLGGTVPATPEELLTLHMIEERGEYRENPHDHEGGLEPPDIPSPEE